MNLCLIHGFDLDTGRCPLCQKKRDIHFDRSKGRVAINVDEKGFIIVEILDASGTRVGGTGLTPDQADDMAQALMVCAGRARVTND